MHFTTEVNHEPLSIDAALSRLGIYSLYPVVKTAQSLINPT